jgi:DNA polymerase-1
VRLVIDFETVDPYLDKLGSGWAHGRMIVLGAALRWEHEKHSVYIRNKEEILEYVEKATVLIAHNLQYDIGILLMWGVDVSKYLLIDTMILAKLVNSVHLSYSLDALGKEYLGESKSDTAMGLAAIRYRLYNVSRKTKPRSERWKKDKMRSAIKFSKQHMDQIERVRPDLVEKYAKQDTDLTANLYDLLMRKLGPSAWIEKISYLYKLLLKSRQRGVRIDIDKVHEVRQILMDVENSNLDWLISESGNPDFNPNSPKDLPALMDKFGVKYPKTPKGNPSITKDWLDKQDSEVCLHVREFRRHQKARRDFCDSIITTQELMPLKKRGRVYPEFRVFGAKTGRFSCANPNIQQIPARDEVIGPLIRSMYIPEDGETWYSLDFSSQESRLQVHYASLIGAEGAGLLVEEFKKDPNLDLHSLVAEIAGIGRTEAKTINLGLSYGMGTAKLAHALGVTPAQARVIIENYNTAMPFLKELSRKCNDTLGKKGSILTLGGRQSKLDPPIFDKDTQKMISFEYKGLNKLIQGSAADQVIEAMIQIEKAGIPILFSVHDEINFSSSSPEMAEEVKKIMENCTELEVPMVTDIGQGNNWSKAK